MGMNGHEPFFWNSRQQVEIPRSVRSLRNRDLERVPVSSCETNASESESLAQSAERSHCLTTPLFSQTSPRCCSVVGKPMPVGMI